MAPKHPLSPRIQVRRSVVVRAWHHMESMASSLDREAILEQQVYVPSRLTPESVGKPTPEGGLLLRFVRSTEFSPWQLDETRVEVLEDD